MSDPEAKCSETDCKGAAVQDGRCVGHLGLEELTKYVAQLSYFPGLNARGAMIDRQRSEELRDLLMGRRLGVIDRWHSINFREAQFSGGPYFPDVEFRGLAIFSDAQLQDPVFGPGHFESVADFSGARFSGDLAAWFAQVRFDGSADFSGAEFSLATFMEAQFGQRADFTRARVIRGIRFTGAQFRQLAKFTEAEVGAGDFGNVEFNVADFSGTRFSSKACFRGAQFSRLCSLGPLRAKTLDLTAAVFDGPAVIHGACSTIEANDVRARESFTLTGRGCDITLTGARFDKPARIGSSPPTVKFPSSVAKHDEKAPRLLSVEGTDLSNVTLAGLDLSACRFIGAYNLDQVHIDGPPNFTETPGRRWTRRMTLAEEQHWRARYDRRSMDWYPLRDRLDQALTLERRALSLDPNPSLPHDAARTFARLANYQWLSREARAKYEQIRDEVTLPYNWLAARTTAAGTEAARVQAVYRELRKSFEDAKNEPGAADFYYGEMEMRRMASRADPSHRFENALLTAYWAISGYGLRASRALLALLLALALATVVFSTVGFGRTQQTVYVPVRPTVAGQPVTYTQKTVPDGKPGLGDAAYYSIQSATSLLREPTTEPLTTIGRITEITMRLLGPLLLGLALLALRGRVKR